MKLNKQFVIGGFIALGLITICGCSKIQYHWEHWKFHAEYRIQSLAIKNENRAISNELDSIELELTVIDENLKASRMPHAEVERRHKAVRARLNTAKARVNALGARLEQLEKFRQLHPVRGDLEAAKADRKEAEISK